MNKTVLAILTLFLLPAGTVRAEVDLSSANQYDGEDSSATELTDKQVLSQNLIDMIHQNSYEVAAEILRKNPDLDLDERLEQGEDFPESPADALVSEFETLNRLNLEEYGKDQAPESEDSQALHELFAEFGKRGADLEGSRKTLLEEQKEETGSASPNPEQTRYLDELFQRELGSISASGIGRAQPFNGSCELLAFKKSLDEVRTRTFNGRKSRAPKNSVTSYYTKTLAPTCYLNFRFKSRPSGQAPALTVSDLSISGASGLKEKGLEEQIVRILEDRVAAPAKSFSLSGQ